MEIKLYNFDILLRADEQGMERRLHAIDISFELIKFFHSSKILPRLP
jgi:hypothetical protein